MTDSKLAEAIRAIVREELHEAVQTATVREYITLAKHYTGQVPVAVTAEDVTGALSDIGRTLGWPTDAAVFASALTARLAARGKA